MKNATELAKELAALYGLQFVESQSPGNHIVLGKNGEERALLPADFPSLFGLDVTMRPASSEFKSIESIEETLSWADFSADTSKIVPVFNELINSLSSVSESEINFFALAA